MTAPRDPAGGVPETGESDSEATVRMPRPDVVRHPPVDKPVTDDEAEDFDSDSTLVRDDWESTVIRRVAPHVAAVQSSIAEEGARDDQFGWESEGLRRLPHEVQKTGR
jgi:hypothetical protein